MFMSRRASSGKLELLYFAEEERLRVQQRRALASYRQTERLQVVLREPLPLAPGMGLRSRQGWAH